MTSVRTSTAQDIIKGALLKAGITPAEQNINAVDQENALEALNDIIKQILVDAIERAKQNFRKTVMAKDL